MGTKQLLVGTALGAAIATIYFRGIDPNILQKAREAAQQNLPQTVYVQCPHPLPAPDRIEHSFVCVYGANINGLDFKLPISTAEYFKYKKLSHRISDISQLLNFITYEDQIVKGIGNDLTKDLATPEEKAKAILTFTSSLVYDDCVETSGADYVKFPLETMVEGGDCEDFAILASALMKSIGIETALIYHPPKDGPSGHVSLGICGNFEGSYYEFAGRKFYSVEPNGKVWRSDNVNPTIGQVMKKYETSSVQIFFSENKK